MTSPASTVDQNILPVQAYFNLDGSFNTFIGQGQPFVISATESIGVIDTAVNGTFYPTFSPVSSGQITNIDITSSKLTWNPSTGVFSAPTFTGALNGTALNTANITGGTGSNLVYQITAGQTGFIANGSSGQFLVSNGTNAPSWSTVATSVTIVDDTTNSGTFYPLFYSATSGSTNTVETSSTKLQYVPSTGTLSATIFSGSGASLTNIPNSALTNPSFTLGNTNISLGNNVTTIAGLTSVSSTTFVGALTGNADTATLATNATNTAITDNTSSNATWYPTIVSNSTGNLPITTSSSKLSFVPSTGTLTATTFSGAATNLSGGAANRIAYQTAANTTAFITAPTAGSTVLNWGGSSFSWVSIGGGTMVYPAAGIPNSSGTGWNASYTTSGSGTVVALATSPVFVTPTLGVATATSLTENTFAVVSQKDVGTAPNQIPLNQYLGKLAFQDAAPLTNNPLIDTQTTSVSPSLNLDFVNSKTLDPRITFTRASTATYYDGKTNAIAEQNSVLRSQTFQNAVWTASTLTPLDNQATAPDGTSTACLLTATVGSGTHSLLQNVGAGYSMVFSCYAKAGTSNFITIIANNSVVTSQWATATFNLSTGTYTQNTTSGATTTYSITPMGSLGGGGWYRIAVSYSIPLSSPWAPSSVRLQIASGATPTNGSYGLETWIALGTETVYVWGAQYENRLTPSAYSPTTSNIVNNDIPQLITASANTPRFDYNPTTGQALGLLLENSITNLVLYSADYSQTNWTKNQCAVSTTYPSSTISPDGGVNAQFIQEDGTTNNHSVSQSITKAASATSYSYSAYFKASSRTYAWIQASDGAGNSVTAYFNLTTGTISSPATIAGNFTLPTIPTFITSVGNGWYRCNICFTTNTATTIVVSNGLSLNGTSASYAGDSKSGLYVWGAQLETGPNSSSWSGLIATSYTPTLGVAGGVARVGDTATMSNTALNTVFNPQQGTVLFTGSYQMTTNVNLWSINSNAYGIDTMTLVSITGYSSTTPYFTINGAPGTGSLITSSGPLNTFGQTVSIRNASSYGPTSASTVNNGFSVGTAFFNASRQTTANSLSMGGNGSGVSYVRIYVTKFAYYPVQLSNAELQEIAQ